MVTEYQQFVKYDATGDGKGWSLMRCLHCGAVMWSSELRFDGSTLCPDCGQGDRLCYVSSRDPELHRLREAADARRMKEGGERR